VEIDYEGSLGIDSDLMKAANILPYELVQVYNISNGERFETYAIKEPPGSGTVALKGAAARKGARGDLITITCYTSRDDRDLEDPKPAVVLVDKNNEIKEGT
jgi:aspartate 1-decarboxylase